MRDSLIHTLLFLHNFTLAQPETMKKEKNKIFVPQFFAFVS